MNSSNDKLKPALRAAVDACREQDGDADAAERAQTRLMQALDAKSGPARAVRGPRAPWAWGALAATALVVLVLLAVPLLPSGNGVAFATVQQHLRDFRSLRIDIRMHMPGAARMPIQVLVDDHGNARIHNGASTNIINVEQHGMLVLLEDAHKAMRIPLNGTRASAGGEVLKALGKIRDFRGRAQRLQRTRMIDGQRAIGWTLDMPDQRDVLWANASGMPLLFDIDHAGVRMSLRFHFDVPLPADAFSLQPPTGYTLLGPEGAED